MSSTSYNLLEVEEIEQREEVPDTSAGGDPPRVVPWKMDMKKMVAVLLLSLGKHKPPQSFFNQDVIKMLVDFPTKTMISDDSDLTESSDYDELVGPKESERFKANTILQMFRVFYIQNETMKSVRGMKGDADVLFMAHNELMIYWEHQMKKIEDLMKNPSMFLHSPTVEKLNKKEYDNLLQMYRDSREKKKGKSKRRSFNPSSVSTTHCEILMPQNLFQGIFGARDIKIRNDEGADKINVTIDGEKFWQINMSKMFKLYDMTMGWDIKVATKPPAKPIKPEVITPEETTVFIEEYVREVDGVEQVLRRDVREKNTMDMTLSCLYAFYEHNKKIERNEEQMGGLEAMPLQYRELKSYWSQQIKKIGQMLLIATSDTASSSTEDPQRLSTFSWEGEGSSSQQSQALEELFQEQLEIDDKDEISAEWKYLSSSLEELFIRLLYNKRVHEEQLVIRVKNVFTSGGVAQQVVDMEQLIDIYTLSMGTHQSNDFYNDLDIQVCRDTNHVLATKACTSKGAALNFHISEVSIKNVMDLLKYMLHMLFVHNKKMNFDTLVLGDREELKAYWEEKMKIIDYLYDYDSSSPAFAEISRLFQYQSTIIEDSEKGVELDMRKLIDMLHISLGLKTEADSYMDDNATNAYVITVDAFTCATPRHGMYSFMQRKNIQVINVLDAVRHMFKVFHIRDDTIQPYFQSLGCSQMKTYWDNRMLLIQYLVTKYV